MRYADFNLSELAHEVYQEAVQSADDKRIHLRCEFSSDSPIIVNSDQQRVRQILTNLVSNGIKYTDSGEVVITLREDLIAQHVIVSVRDTGPGVPMDQQDHIFEPYTRLSRHSSSGTGLGLPISRRLAHLLGTELLLTSDIGRGSTFSFQLPLNTQDAVAP